MISLLALIWVLGSAHLAAAQLPGMPPAQGTTQPPREVTRYGEYEVTWVRSPLNNHELFEIASPTIWDRSSLPENQLPVETRAAAIKAHLLRQYTNLLTTDQTQLWQKPQVEVAVLNNRPIVQVNNPNKTRPLKLVTVTEPDGNFHQEDLQVLAQQWQTILQAENKLMQRYAAPSFLLGRVGQSLLILLGLVLGTLALFWWRRRIQRRVQRLKAEREQALETMAQAEEALEATSPDAPAEDITPAAELSPEAQQMQAAQTFRDRLLADRLPVSSQERQLKVYSWLRWVNLWLLLLLWYVGLYFVVSRLPLLMGLGGWVIAVPLQLLFVWFFISITIRLGKWLVDYFVNVWKRNPYLSLGMVQRQSLRSVTIAGAMKGLITVVLVAIGIIWTLDTLNFPTGSLLVGGAIVGLALSFGAQNVVRDLVNGFLILAEDQFAVGDVINLSDGVGGLVENLNLRVTQLRDGEGRLITVPNSAISTAKNLTRLWSRVDFSIDVAYENDPRQVLDLLEAIGQEMYDEPEWREHLPEKPAVLGFDSVSHAGMTARVWIKTAPLQQWAVDREYRLRVRQAFAEHGIAIGKPQRIVEIPSAPAPMNL